MGAPELERNLCLEISKRTGIPIILPSYRLAPKHPYPAALQDVTDAYDWLARQDWVDQENIIIGGTSAGGGLAAALTLALQERDIVPRALFLHQPMLDHRTCDKPDPPKKRLRLWNGQANRFAWSAYLQSTPLPVPPTASPAMANTTQLARFPKTWISVGTEDLFYTEAKTFSERLSQAGIAFDWVPVQGAFHGFETLGLQSPLTQCFLDEFGSALTDSLSCKT